jgi:hypothetical protein
MSVSHPSSIRPFFIFKPRHHAFPNASSSKRETALLPNDDVLPTADVFTECFEENLLPNDTLLPNSAHRSVSFLTPIFGVNKLEELLTRNNPDFVRPSHRLNEVRFRSYLLFAFVLSTTIQLLHINGNCGGKVLLAH